MLIQLMLDIKALFLKKKFKNTMREKDWEVKEGVEEEVEEEVVEVVEVAEEEEDLEDKEVESSLVLEEEEEHLKKEKQEMKLSKNQMAAKEDNITKIETLIVDPIMTDEEETKKVKLKIKEETTEEIEEVEITKEEVIEDQELLI
jgi:hypothetical protein